MDSHYSNYTEAKSTSLIHLVHYIVLILLITLMKVLVLLVLINEPRQFEVLHCLLSVIIVAVEKLKFHCKK